VVVKNPRRAQAYSGCVGARDLFRFQIIRALCQLRLPYGLYCLRFAFAFTNDLEAE